MQARQLVEGEEARPVIQHVEESCPSSEIRTGSSEHHRSWSGCCCYCCLWRQGAVGAGAEVDVRVVPDMP